MEDDGLSFLAAIQLQNFTDITKLCQPIDAIAATIWSCRYMTLDQWELRAQRVEDRLDVLFLDSDGAPVVAELKRGEAPDTVDLQALK